MKINSKDIETNMVRTDILEHPRVISFAELTAYRVRRGLCPLCELKCYQVGIFGKIPITKPGLILEGRCLKCNPIALNEQNYRARRPKSSKFFDKLKSNRDSGTEF